MKTFSGFFGFWSLAIGALSVSLSGFNPLGVFSLILSGIFSVVFLTLTIKG